MAKEVTRVFTKKFLTDVLQENAAKIVRDKMVSQGRWRIDHELIFEYEEKLYRTYYAAPATEMQEQEPWDEAEVECQEVEAYEKTVVAYRAVQVST